jgi:CheY-like chemotaxis protein
MPGLSGFDTAAAIQSNPSLSTPIVMLTSVGGQGDVARCREIGIDGYLHKPLRQSELIETIQRVMESAPPPELDASVPRTDTPRRSGRPIRILVAEDNKINQVLAVRLFEKYGHHVTLAENGVAAVEAFDRDRFDLVLMDLQMPEMDGFEAALLIRQREADLGRHIPIIAVTAHAMKGDEEKCLSFGFDGYIPKPVDPERMLDAIYTVSQGPFRS